MKRVNIRSVKQGTGELVELYLEEGLTGGRLLCPQNLIPAPGQYLLAYDLAYNLPLPTPVFNAGSIPRGFSLAPPIPRTWQPGTTLSIRGPLGHGFTLPTNVRKIALAALGETSARLKPLLVEALNQGAAVVLVSNLENSELPSDVEIQSVAGLAEIVQWADYLALDMPRESLPGLKKMLGFAGQDQVRYQAQVLVHTPMPCGGMGDCGVCAVTVRRKWKMACKDGPVFDLNELI